MGIVTKKRVFDDGKTESDTAILPGPSGIHPKETLCQSWQGIIRYAASIVGHCEAATVGIT